MSQSFYAPCPWRLERNGSVSIEIIAADNSQVAIFNLKYNPVRVETNARLIAAAPELLSVCESVYRHLDHLGSSLYDNDLAELYAAIAKSQGKS